MNLGPQERITGMHTDAEISGDGKYRYWLHRWWTEGPVLVVIGLNPSTADAWEDDPTIRRCIGFARREGCGSLLMLNLFSYRSTDPSVLELCLDFIGPRNDDFLQEFVKADRKVVAAWGSHKLAGERFKKCYPLQNANLLCFGTTKDGSPKHPLYLKSDTPLVPWRSK